MKYLPLLLLLAGCHGLRVGVGPTIVTDASTGSATLLVQQDVSEHVRVSAGYITPGFKRENDWTPAGAWEIGDQYMLGVEYVWRSPKKRWSLSVGPYAFTETDRITSCRWLWRPAAEFHVTPHWSLGLSHFSNAGFCGQTTLVNPHNDKPIVVRTNVGYDAALVWWTR